MKIMIVDDERDVEFLFRLRFRNEIRSGALEFIFAFSAGEALEQLRLQDAPDVVFVLSDINMPEMTGLELLKILKAEFPRMKICMITAYSDEKNFRTAMDYGADEYFTKPIDFEKLKSTLFAA